MFDGLLPFSRASGILDLIALALFIVLPAFGYSLYLVRVRKNYEAHRKLQIILSIVLLLAVVVFEADMRIYGWRHLAEASPFYNSLVDPVLWIHLFFAVSTTLLWIYVIVGAMRNFPTPAAPNEHSGNHRKAGRLAAIGMLCTAISAWAFYILAFVA